MAEGKKSRLTLYIGVSIVAAVLVALVIPQFALNLQIGGEDPSAAPCDTHGGRG